MGSTSTGSDGAQRFALVDGWLTAYQIFGPSDPSVAARAPLVMLLHGLGAAGETYGGVARRLADRFRLLVPDSLGSGRTAKPLIEYTPQEMAAHLAGLLRELGMAPVDAIVGHSQGAAVAVELSQQLGGVERLVLINPPPPGGLRWMRGVTSLPLGARTAEVISALLPHRRIARAWLSFLYADPSRVTPEVIAAYEATAGARGYAGATARAMHSLARLRLSVEEAPPTLLLWGAEDKLFPATLAKEWQARLTSSQLIVLPATGHCPHEEQPEAVAFALRNFLAPGDRPAAALTPADAVPVGFGRG